MILIPQNELETFLDVFQKTYSGKHWSIKNFTDGLNNWLKSETKDSSLVNLGTEINDFIVWATVKDFWVFSTKDDLWHAQGWKPRTTEQLYEIFKKETDGK